MNKINWFHRSDDPKSFLCVGERAGYALSNTGLCFTYILILGFMSFYYTDVAGIPAGVVGTIMLISRMFDGVSDLIMGNIIDKTKTKLGKARPWLLICAFPNAVAAILAFSVPVGMEDFHKYIYVFVTYNILNTITFTAGNVSMFTVNSLMTDNSEEHAKCGIWMQIGGSVAMLIVQYTCVSLVTKLGGTPHSWSIAISIYAIIGGILMFISGLTIRERVVSEGKTEQNEKKITFLRRVKELFKNKYWIIFTLIFALFTILEQGTGAGALYYATYIMKNPEAYATFSAAQLIVQLVVLTVAMTFVLKKIGQRACIVGCFSLIAAASVIQWFVWGMPVVIFCSILRGLAYALFLSSQGAVIADISAYSTKKSGFGMEGIANAGVTFGYKCGTGIGMAIVGWLLQIFRYNGMAEVQTASGI